MHFAKTASESKDSSVYSLRSAYGVLGAAELGAERKNGGIFRSLIWAKIVKKSKLFLRRYHTLQPIWTKLGT